MTRKHGESNWQFCRKLQTSYYFSQCRTKTGKRRRTKSTEYYSESSQVLPWIHSGKSVKWAFLVHVFYFFVFFNGSSFFLSYMAIFRLFLKQVSGAVLNNKNRAIFLLAMCIPFVCLLSYRRYSFFTCGDPLKRSLYSTPTKIET